MTVLSAQSIRRLCVTAQPLITPFTERGVVNGKSYGLSACTYDCRIDQDLILEPMPFMSILAYTRGDHLRDLTIESADILDIDARAVAKINNTNHRALASTMERFAFPHNVCGSVLDKSSFARVFVSAFNTHLDPGWDGFLTVELVNLGDTVVEYKQGDPVCQIKFEWLDEPTDLPYVGRKYSDQPARPVAAINEDS